MPFSHLYEFSYWYVALGVIYFLLKFLISYSVLFFTAVGITNQRETTVVWDKVTGEPLHNAIS